VHQIDKAVEIHAASFGIDVLADALEYFLDHHGVLVAQLWESLVHESADVDSSSLNLRIGEILQVSRLFLSRFILFLRFFLTVRWFLGTDRLLGNFFLRHQCV